MNRVTQVCHGSIQRQGHVRRQLPFCRKVVQQPGTPCVGLVRIQTRLASFARPLRGQRRCDGTYVLMYTPRSSVEEHHTDSRKLLNIRASCSRRQGCKKTCRRIPVSKRKIRWNVGNLVRSDHRLDGGKGKPHPRTGYLACEWTLCLRLGQQLQRFGTASFAGPNLSTLCFFWQWLRGWIRPAFNVL